MMSVRVCSAMSVSAMNSMKQSDSSFSRRLLHFPCWHLFSWVLTFAIIINSYESESKIQLPPQEAQLKSVFDFLQALTREWKPNIDIILYSDNNSNSSSSANAESWSNMDKWSRLIRINCPNCCLSIRSKTWLQSCDLYNKNNNSTNTNTVYERKEGTRDDVVYIFGDLGYEELIHMMKMEQDQMSANKRSRSSSIKPVYIFNTLIVSNNSDEESTLVVQQLKRRLQNLFAQISTNSTLTSIWDHALSLNSNMYILTTPISSSSKNPRIDFPIHKKWGLFEFYSLHGNGTGAGSVIQVNPVQVHSFGNKLTTRSDFHRLVIRATAPEKNMTQGEVIWRFDRATNLSVLSHGFGVDIFKCLQHALNFTWVSVPTKGWAKLLPMGNQSTTSSGIIAWDVGMAQEVAEDRADIALAKTSILPYRAASFSYLVPIHALILTAFFRQPSISTVRNILLLPFETQLWIAFIVTWLLLLLSMKFVIILRVRFITFADHEPVFENDAEMEAALTESEQWSHSSLWCFGAICQQGWYLIPHTVQVKLVLVLGLLVGLIGFVAYSAAMVSLFTVASLPLNSFEQLMHSSLVITIDRDNDVARMLTTRHSSNQLSGVNVASDNNKDNRMEHTYTTVANLLIQKVAAGGNASLLPATEGQARLLTHPTAYLCFPDKFYTTIKSSYPTKADDRFLCSEISSFSVTSVPFRSGLFVAKGSVYKEHFNCKLLVVFTSGLMRRYVKGYEATYTPICTFGFRRSYDGAGVNDLVSAYMILVVGLGVSFGFMMVEQICSRLMPSVKTLRN